MSIFFNKPAREVKLKIQPMVLYGMFIAFSQLLPVLNRFPEVQLLFQFHLTSTPLKMNLEQTDFQENS